MAFYEGLHGGDKVGYVVIHDINVDLALQLDDIKMKTVDKINIPQSVDPRYLTVRGAFCRKCSKVCL